MSAQKVIVVGGNGAGMSAASQVKRQKPDWEVVVLEKGSYISYAGCGMPYYIEGLVSEFEQLIDVTPEEAVQKRGVDLRLGTEVTEIMPEEKKLRVKNAEGETLEDFDYLVIATGSIPITEHIEIAPSGKIFTLKTLEDTAEIYRFVREESPQTCAVIGGGYIAVEMLEAFKALGIETHLVHRREDLARTFEKEISDIIKEEMSRQGIVPQLNTRTEKILQQDKKVHIHTGNGRLEYDLVLVATGVRPNTDFLKGSGIELGFKGAIRVNKYLQTNYDYVYAAGDCTEATHLVTGQPAYVPLALKANKEGYITGLNVCGQREVFPGILGTAITKFFDLGIARTGLTLDEAQKSGFNAVKYSLSSRSRARYYPGGGTLHTVVIMDRDDGRILGAQLAGPLDAVKRIDVYAVMLHNRMSIKEAFDLDIAYAPPFSPVYDPVILAARLGRKYV